MAKEIKVIYVASDDPEFGPLEDTAILFGENIVLDNTYSSDESVIFVLDSPIESSEKVLTIDRTTCKRLHVNFFGMNDVVDFGFLAECSFLESAKYFAK